MRLPRCAVSREAANDIVAAMGQPSTHAAAVLRDAP